MVDALKAIKERHSSRGQFDSSKPVENDKLKVILEAARWAPTAHNLQNYEVIVIDDEDVLKAVESIKSMPSEEFIRENFQQMSMSEEGAQKEKSRHTRQPVPAQMEGCKQA